MVTSVNLVGRPCQSYDCARLERQVLVITSHPDVQVGQYVDSLISSNNDVQVGQYVDSLISSDNGVQVGQYAHQQR